MKKSLFKNNRFFQLSLGIFAILIIAITVLILLFFVGKRNSYENIDNLDELWKVYDLNVKELENNLNEIMDVPSDGIVCTGLKDKTINDTGYGKALNELACELYLYYYNLIEYNENFHNYLIDYRNKSQISSDEIKSLKFNMQNDDHINSSLEGMKLKYYDEDYIIQELYDKIDYFLENFDLGFYNQDDLTYSKIFVHKIFEISYITYLSNWLKAEYYDYLN